MKRKCHISKSAPFLAIGVLLFASGAGRQETRPPNGSPLTKPDSLLHHESWFVWQREGEGIGYQHLRLKPAPDSLLRLELICEVKGKMGSGQGIALQANIGCRCDLYLSLLDATVRDPEGEAMVYEATVEYDIPYGCSSGQISVLSGPKKGQITPLPTHTVCDSTLPILIERLPFQKGKVFEFNLLEMSRLRVTNGFAISYLGVENVSRPDGDARLHRFDVTGPREPGLSFWINEDHKLIKYASSDGAIECNRSDKQEALRILDP